MAWKVSSVVETRFEFVSRVLEGEKISDLCREFNISRKTGYKFLERYQGYGRRGLEDFSKAPLRVARKTSESTEKLIIDLRLQRPTWGSLKIREYLKRKEPGIKLPAASTITEILHRNGMIKQKQKREYVRVETGLATAQNPNDIWATDFKGQFRLANGKYCYPLTISDLASRYFLMCEALESTKGAGVFEVYERAFCQYGLPKIIRSDNGAPFASTGILGLTKLSVWWIKLGITPERIKPGHPEQNGSHERKHLTLKQETTRPVGKNQLHQQEKFDEFLDIFNTERPHEALGMKTPSELYLPSPKSYPTLQSLEYPDCDAVKTVNASGCIKLTAKEKYFLGRAFSGEQVGLRQITTHQWVVKYAHLVLGYLDSRERVFTQGELPVTTPEV